MTNAMPASWLRPFVLLALVCAGGSTVHAQFDFPALEKTGQGGAVKAEAPVAVKAELVKAKGGEPARLLITADVAEGWHIYSLTQKKGGPIPTKITVEAGDGYTVSGDLKPLTPPEAQLEPAFNNLLVETHEGRVTWTAPLELAADTDLGKLTIPGKITYQACDQGRCLPPATVAFAARLVDGAGAAKSSAPLGTFKSSTAHATIRGYVEPKVAAPGETLRLVLAADPDPGWHIYPLAAKDPNKISKPTLIVLTQTSGWQASAPKTDGKVVEKESQLTPGETEKFYDQTVTWTIELAIPRDAKPGKYPLVGLMGYHTCQDAGCDRPQAVRFRVDVPVERDSVAGQLPLEFTPAASYKQAADAAAGGDRAQSGAAELDLSRIRPAAAASRDQSLVVMAAFGFLGGLILNLMPCVLPVIGLKILSFVEQSGHSRRHIFSLNLWYSLGMLAVFMVLATLPVAYRLLRNEQFGWGQQFAYDSFNITLAAIVFVMALSFLGVWEIPIPGFVGSGKANDLAAKEGFAGAFAKGAITTVLATPCSGPFLGTALAFAFGEPAPVVYAMFACIGLGMASPYLLIGAFPRLIRFLPKPGAWMDTFKQAMGFVLLGTVVYLMTFIQWTALVPTVALLMGLWAACWWIGRAPLFADFQVKARAWAGGAALAAIVGLFAFQWLGPIMAGRFDMAVDKIIEKRVREKSFAGRDAAPTMAGADDKDHLPWQPFSMARLQELTKAEKTVMLDFTADWCATCQALKKFVLDTADVKGVVDTNGVVPLLVDMTRYPPAEAALLQTLSGGQSVPVLAIFPAGRPNEPIVLSNGYTKGILLKKLGEAGPSKDAAKLQMTALRPQ
ncbi:MAG: thioredoxin family protein [Planctomycetia bacterium]|nr:thioredoxin family protein [Planctomycetia bacterium]